MINAKFYGSASTKQTSSGNHQQIPAKMLKTHNSVAIKIYLMIAFMVLDLVVNCIAQTIPGNIVVLIVLAG